MEKQSDSELARAQLDLLNEGVNSYLDALVAIREFRREVQSRTRKVVEYRLDELSGVMGVSLKRDQIVKHINPDGIPDNFDGNWAWIAARIKIIDPLPLDCYFGMFFRRDEKDQTSAIAMMSPSKDVFQKIWVKCKEIGESKLKETYKGEIAFLDKILPGEMNHFEEKLNEMIDLWVKVWKALGGVSGLRMTVGAPSGNAH